MKKPQRYMIGEQTDDATIQPQGVPIKHNMGWWYAVDEADKIIDRLTEENKRLREALELAQKRLRMPLRKIRGDGFRDTMRIIDEAINHKEAT